MTTYIIRRFLSIIPILLGVTIIVFLLMHIAPGGPVRLMLGPIATQEQVDNLREELGLNKPVYMQYLNWITNVLRGDLGESIRTKASVSDLIIERLGPTLEFTMLAFMIAIFGGIFFGVTSAVRQYSIFDYLAQGMATFWICMPYFWLGLVLMLFFSVYLRWLPISGRGGPFWTLSGIRHLILPIFTLGTPQIAIFSRLTRSSMLEVLREDYITTARSKGLRERIVIYRHALKNASLPLVTLFGMRMSWLFGGAVVTETVFAWPGMGRLLVESVFQRDYPIVQGVVLLISVIVILGNLTADVAYAFVDPRIRI